MKKKFVSIKNFADLSAIRRQINNAFSEKGAEVAKALNDLLTELEGSDVEVNEEELKAKVEEIFKNLMPNTEEVVANALAKKMAEIKNAINPELSVEVKNQITAAILRSKKEEVKNAVNEVLVKNGVTGMTFENAVDYVVSESWGNLNPLLMMFKKVPYTKFFYNSADLSEAKILAKQWDKSGKAEKVIQEIEVNGKTINTKYVYKRQAIAQEDMDEIERVGEGTNFLRFINEELDRQIANTIVKTILVGDSTNASADRLTTFESIGTKSASDVFTTIVTGTATLAKVREASDKVKNPNGLKKVAIMSQTTLTAISTYIAATGATEDYRSKEEIAGKIGVDEIVVVDVLPATTHAIIMIPEEYWYVEKNSLAVSYPKYEMNQINYQKERNCGGAIHGLYSTAVLKNQ